MIVACATSSSAVNRKRRLGAKIRCNVKSWCNKEIYFGNLLRKRERQDVGSRCDCDVLLSVDCVGHRRGLHRMVGLKVPKVLPGTGVDCGKSSAAFAEEKQAARGGQHSRIVRLHGSGQ